jgi:hypothetical protein
VSVHSSELGPPPPHPTEYIFYCKRAILFLSSSKILTPPPIPQQRRGVHTRRAERGMGGSIFLKTRERGLPSYSKICTLCPTPSPHGESVHPGGTHSSPGEVEKKPSTQNQQSAVPLAQAYTMHNHIHKALSSPDTVPLKWIFSCN